MGALQYRLLTIGVALVAAASAFWFFGIGTASAHDAPATSVTAAQASAPVDQIGNCVGFYPFTTFVSPYCYYPGLYNPYTVYPYYLQPSVSNIYCLYYLYACANNVVVPTTYIAPTTYIPPTTYVPSTTYVPPTTTTPAPATSVTAPAAANPSTATCGSSTVTVSGSNLDVGVGLTVGCYQNGATTVAVIGASNGAGEAGRSVSACLNGGTCQTVQLGSAGTAMVTWPAPGSSTSTRPAASTTTRPAWALSRSPSVR